MKASLYLDRIAKKLGDGGKPLTDYRLRLLLGVTSTAISRYRHNKSHFEEPVAIRVAELLDINPQSVLTDIAAERSKCPAAKRVWRRLAKHTSRAAAILLVVSATNISMQATDTASAASEKRGITCILCKIARWLLGALGTGARARCPA